MGMLRKKGWMWGGGKVKHRGVGKGKIRQRSELRWGKGTKRDRGGENRLDKKKKCVLVKEIREQTI